MFTHILVPTDGSDTAQLALTKVAGMAKAFGSRVTVVHVLEPYPAMTMNEMDFGIAQQQYVELALQQSQRALDAAQQMLATHGVQAQTQPVESASAWHGIVDTAKAVGADLIVMGSHGRRGWQKLVLGSVTQKVVSHAPHSVLVVHGAPAAE